ncbi:hypothetical protein ACFU8Q_29490 [Streptomyces sp. NPDC057543]|uniref:hypothetical protein n=1 Tax=Streptomyces sp. NPDC057543 TaxID=3346163 RepID=UPI0036CCE0B4
MREPYQCRPARGVFHGVRQGFLHDAIRRESGAYVHVRLLSVLDQFDRLAARSRLLHQVRHPARQRRPFLGRRLAGRLQHAEQEP